MPDDPNDKKDKIADGRIWLSCKVCSREFYLAKKEVDFYKASNYALPRSCWNCRQFAKKLKESGGT